MIDSVNDYRRNVSRDVRTRNLSAIISGTLFTHTKQDDRTSNDLLSNYNSSVFTNRKTRAPKYISTRRNLLSRLFSGSAMLKVLRSLGAKTSRILSIQLSLSALRFVLFLMCRPLAKNSESTIIFSSFA